MEAQEQNTGTATDPIPTAKADTLPKAPGESQTTETRNDNRVGPRFARPDKDDLSYKAAETRRLLDVLGERPYYDGAMVRLWQTIFGTSEGFPQEPQFDDGGKSETDRERADRKPVAF